MARPISMDDALAACRVRLGELTYENTLLREQLKTTEAELEEAQTGLPTPPSAPPGMDPQPAGPVEIRETEAKVPVSGGASRPGSTGR